MWRIDQLEINGGFLPGLKLRLPAGLICIIGPRGSGKSTLAEAFRFAIKGTIGVSKQRLDLLQANFASSGLVTLTANTNSGVVYTIKRSYKQPAVLLSGDGRTISNVDLDRGTFLPLDAYNGPEIESIADETLGQKRRALLDELRGEELSRIQLSLGEHRRALQANADRMRAARRSIDDLSERIEEFGDVRAKLDSLDPLPETGPSIEYTKASKQQQCNSRERKRIDSVLELIDSLERDSKGLQERTLNPKSFGLVEEGSANATWLQKQQGELQKSFGAVSAHIRSLIADLQDARNLADRVRNELTDIHAKQQAEFTNLHQVHQLADARYRLQLELEQRLAALKELEAERDSRRQELTDLLAERKSLRARFLLEREQVSGLRDAIGNLNALAHARALPRSHCSIRFMSLLRPLVVAGVVVERRSGAGRQVVVEDASAFQAFIRRTFPMENAAANSPSRVIGVRYFRDTKSYRADRADVLRVRAFIPGILRKNGRPVDVRGATANHGVFSFRLASEYTLHGRVALVENPTVFDLFERLELALPLVIYGRGRVSTRVLDWLANQRDKAFSLLHLPDYDPVGLSEFERIRNRLGSGAQMYLPENLEDLFHRFGNRELLEKPRSQRLLANLRRSNVSEVQALVKLIDSHNAGLEQEALIH